MCCYFDQVFLVEQILNFSETDLVEVKVERYFQVVLPEKEPMRKY